VDESVKRVSYTGADRRIIMGDSLQGQVAIVTGASGALGSDVVKSLLAAGATVVAVDHGSAGASQDTGITRLAANLTDAQEVNRLIANVTGQFAAIDVLVHVMGGFAGGASVAETDDATWRKMMDINLNAAFYVLRAVVPIMRRAEKGRIIAIGSRQAVQPAAGVGAYSASKAALVSLLQTVAIENKDKNIRANIILPGTMDTPANRAAMPKANFEKWVKPARVAELAVFLAGDPGADITGAAIPVYGADV
jgi:NAD(P)-dependent dehydrogenase (short-subunit alcohol dehydrogenase family)